MASPTVTDFAAVLPPPLTSLIIELAPYVATAKWALSVLTWRGEASESWLMLAAWWAICLFGRFSLRYLTPFLILVPLFVHPKKQTTQPSTEESIQHAINDLTELKQALVLSQWKRIQYNIPFRQALRLVGIAYIPFLLVVTFVRTRVLVGIVGTIALSWKSWWFQEIVNVLWYSAFVRYGLARMWSLASGAPLPPGLTHARKDDDLIFITKENNTTDMKILFTILENQRWWMGLDWTAALLPSERPSWCSVGLQPLSPPSTFPLPPTTTSYLPHPHNSMLRIQRRAVWHWEESEWKVVLKLEGTHSDRTQRIAKPLPSSSTVQHDTSKLKQVKEMLNPKEGKQPEASESDASHETHSPTDPSMTDFTDAEGWSYGDNKWEKMSARGGIGKYTRCRRWTRIAVVREEIEEVGPGELGVVRLPHSRSSPQPDTHYPDSPPRADTSSSGLSQAQSPVSEPESTGDRLRQRLKAAVRASNVPS